MNDKDIFYLFLKYKDVVISRYSEIQHNATKARSVVDDSQRIAFNDALQLSEKEIDWQIKTSGRKNNEYLYSFDHFWFYLGKHGWESYGVFSYIPLYRRSFWTPEVIEQYKDAIVWPLLFEYGNFMLDEYVMNKYENFWSKQLQFIYAVDHIVTKYGSKLRNFKNIGKLSSGFILSHISDIEIFGLCSTGCFELTYGLFKRLYEYYTGTEDLIDGYEHFNFCGLANNTRIIITNETILQIAEHYCGTNWIALIPKITITKDVLRRLYLINPQSVRGLCKLPFSKRRKIVDIIESDNELKTLFGCQNIKVLWQGNLCIYKIDSTSIELAEKKGFEGVRNLPYTYDFSIDLIKNSIESWNKQSFEFFSHMQRTPDTNYLYYKRLTAWDILSEQETLLLDYKLCKFLMTTNVVIGGSYVMEDGHYHTDDIPNHSINALTLFRFRSVRNKEELEKIFNDEDIIEILLKNADKPSWAQPYYITGNIIDSLIQVFFKDFSFDKFKSEAIGK